MEYFKFKDKKIIVEFEPKRNLLFIRGHKYDVECYTKILTLSKAEIIADYPIEYLRCHWKCIIITPDKAAFIHRILF